MKLLGVILTAFTVVSDTRGSVAGKGCRFYKWDGKSVGNECITVGRELVCYSGSWRETNLPYRKLCCAPAASTFGQKRLCAEVHRSILTPNPSHNYLSACQSKKQEKGFKHAKSMNKRLLQSTSLNPKIEFFSASSVTTINFYGFQWFIQPPGPAQTLGNWNTSLASTVYNYTFSVPRNGTGFSQRYNLARIPVPQKTRAMMLTFNTSCIFPVVLQVPAGNIPTVKLETTSANINQMMIPTSQLLGPLGAVNSNVTTVNYQTLSVSEAKQAGLFNVNVTYESDSAINQTSLYFYCPLQLLDNGNFTVVANYSNLSVVPSNFVNTTNVPKATDAQRKNALIIGLVVGVGFPLGLVLMSLIAYCCCLRPKQHNLKKKYDGEVVPEATAAIANSEAQELIGAQKQTIAFPDLVGNMKQREKETANQQGAFHGIVIDQYQEELRPPGPDVPN